MLANVKESCDLGETHEHVENLGRRHKNTPHRESIQEHQRHRRQDEVSKEAAACVGEAKPQHDPETCTEAHDACIPAQLEPERSP